MRLPTTAHTSQPWRIHELASDFQVEDAWALPTPGAGPDDFPVMLAALRAAGGLNEDNPPLVRFLFAVRTAGHGRDRAVPAPDRLPSVAPAMGTRVAPAG